MKTIIYYLSIILFLSPVIAQASCLSNAAIRWDVPEIILEAIILHESGGQPDARNSNKNGSHDYGLMQINTVNIDPLKSQGIIKNKQALMQPCTNIEAGAYLLSQKFKKHGYSWRAVGAYHSETAQYRDKYASKIMKIVNSGPDFAQRNASLLRSTSTY
ncbi:TPA: lytic transglycosylase domain-containing protein [Yersinia enterocolitica]|nr:lytic transglycosylase domain-containing protein [Yersinia enterocolitica]HDL7833889.1 lytic transglycosylase domain-containing protein [Yersinia enterocolitica]HDL7874115.1 lytic transglycosylase domain-containing protein [Yersinia enterocolitica]HDL7887314.1 lytic transglycosylase domain-containing protein [Yersinia enterocolitica]HDL7895984.1 lytic transglycosylase domain-containing protein [Yersinia enterocolitica]